jgi:hypothetical protein
MQDGKDCLLATDYSNNGRVHLFKMNTQGVLELIWSSPRYTATTSASVPRWVRTGDLDGDGNQEIVFPVGAAYAGEVDVFEYDPGTHTFPNTPSITLPATQFLPQLGAGAAFRMNREVAEVYDFDGDGRDELIMANQNNKVYILGIVGDIGGFGSWQIEGGDPTVNPDNGFSGGSWWHSVPADINGNGKKEIVNQYWNYYGFWNIVPLGPDSYRYPTPGRDSATIPAAKTRFYHEYLYDLGHDATAYMGVQPVDVDGDGKQEIAGIEYEGAGFDYKTTLVSLARTDTGVYIWKDSTQFGIIGENLWTLAGKSAGSFWGIGAYDFNGNGRQEILLGGSAEYNVVAQEYKGTGNILSPTSYNNTIVYPGLVAFYHFFDYYDSLGIKRDTIRRESPFVSKMFAGADLNGNGKKEVVVSYQSIADSITYTFYHFDTTVTPKVWKQDSVRKAPNLASIGIRVLEYQTTGVFEPLNLSIVTPDDYRLEQNYPNPFNPSTTIRFSLPLEKKISLVVYDILGKEVKTLINDQAYTKGAHEVVWDGTNNTNHRVASGTYIYTLKFGSFSKSAKMTLLK